MIIVITPFDFEIFSLVRVYCVMFCARDDARERTNEQTSKELNDFFLNVGLFVSRIHTQFNGGTVDFSSSYLISIVINNRSSQQNQNKEIINQLACETSIPILN